MTKKTIAQLGISQRDKEKLTALHTILNCGISPQARRFFNIKGFLKKRKKNSTAAQGENALILLLVASIPVVVKTTVIRAILDSVF